MEDKKKINIRKGLTIVGTTFAIGLVIANTYQIINYLI